MNTDRFFDVKSEKDISYTSENKFFASVQLIINVYHYFALVHTSKQATQVAQYLYHLHLLVQKV